MYDSGFEEKDYTLLKDLEVDLRTNGEANEGSILCFWLYISNCSSFPSVILEQKLIDVVTSSLPFLCLDEDKKITLFPFLCLHKDTPDPAKMGDPFATSKSEFPLKKWVHFGYQITQDFIQLYIDGESVGEKSSTFTTNKDLLSDGLKRIHLKCPDGNEFTFHGYVYGLNTALPTSDIKDQYIKNPPVHLSIDYSSASENEEDSDGVWNIVGGKASCRRIFSIDVILSDSFGCPANKDLEVVASLLYADNEAPVEDSNDAEPPLLMSYDGIEYASSDRPCKLINGRASFKLKISQLSSKCENRLFRIRFNVPKYQSYSFLETLSLPIRCVSRYKSTRTSPLTWRKSSNRIYCINECESPGLEDGSAELIPNIVREAKQSPSSKRIKLGNDKLFPMQSQDFSFKQADKEIDSPALMSENNIYGMRRHPRLENQFKVDNFSSVSASNEATNSGPKSIENPISDLIIFKYCLGCLGEKRQLLKEITESTNEEQLLDFAKKVSMYSGCLHHRHQISIAKKLLSGMHVWNLMSENKPNVHWDTLAFRISGLFLKTARCNRCLTDQDLECLKRIAGCGELASKEHFDRLWYWLYPVAYSISKKVLNTTWDSISPLWIEGFITKEEAEFMLQGPESLREPGTFVLRFPLSRSWPHPDAGNLVATYIGSDNIIHHRLLAYDYSDSSSYEETTPLQYLLLREPELGRLARSRR